MEAEPIQSSVPVYKAAAGGFIVGAAVGKAVEVIDPDVQVVFELASTVGLSGLAISLGYIFWHNRRLGVPTN